MKIDRQGDVANLSPDQLQRLADRLVSPATAQPAREIPLRKPSDPPAPLSYAQRRIWFLDRLDPASGAYNMPVTVELRGELRVPSLAAAFTGVCRRHEALRTTVAVVESVPRQVVAAPRRVALPVVDLAALGDARRGLEARRLAAAHARWSLDVERGPLVRVTLLRLEPRRHRFLLVIHHLVCDGWSVGVLVRETAELYEAHVLGREPSLEPLAIQYGDFAAWQRSRLEGEGAEAVDAVLRRLGMDPAPLVLPTDGRRSGSRTSRAGRLRRRLAHGCGDLKALGRTEGASSAMALLAAIAVVLQRWSGQEDVLVGSPVANRDRVETEGLIGCLVDVLVLRADLSGDPTLRELVRRVREANLQALEQRDVPLEAVLARLPGGRDPMRAPFLRVLYNVLSFPRTELRLPGLELRVEAAGELPAKFDLTFYVAEVDGSFDLSLVYDAELFSAERMAELLDQVAAVVESAAARADEPVSALSLVTREARERLPDAAARLAAVWPGSLPERVRRRAREAPERIAAVDEAGAWSYRALAAAVDAVRDRLLAGGVAAEGVVAVWGHRGASLLPALLGVLEAGAAFLLLDPAHPAGRSLRVLRAVRPDAWLHLEAAGEPPPEITADLAVAGCFRISLGRRLTEGGGASARPAAPVALSPQRLAYLAATSGSTGPPKLVAGTHGPLAHFLDWHCDRFGLGERERVSVLSGLSHDPVLRDLFAPLWSGGRACFPGAAELADPAALVRWMADAGITVVHLTPAHARLLVFRGIEAGALACLRHAFFGGEILEAETARAFRRLAPGSEIVSYYGATETPQGRAWEPLVEASVGAAPLGRGIGDVQLLVLDRRGRPAAAGELGEVAVRTPHQARGYTSPAATAARFVPDAGPPAGGRIYRTGDLGRYLPDGRVAFAGRIDRQVKVRGVRVEPEEVEALLATHPEVAEAAAAIREAPDGTVLAAWVTPRDGRAPEPAALRDHLRALLPEAAVPGAIAVLDRLPRTPNGKLDRRALEALAPARPASFAPRGPVEELLAELWAELLGAERIRADDDFLALGGHSLLAVRLLARIEEAFRVELPLRTLFEATTLRGMAARIGEARNEDPRERWLPPPPVPSAAPGEEAPLSFAQERFWLLELLHPGRAAYHLPVAVRFRGALSAPVLARSLVAVVARHEVLRSIFPRAEHRPVQRVLPAPAPRLPVADLRSLPCELREREAAEIARQAVRRPFDTARGPLLRSALVRLDTRDHVAVLVLHHLVADGWSTGLLVSELGEIYRAAEEARPAALPAMPLQYRDYATWYRGWLQGEALAVRLDYWRRALAGAPREVSLPSDRSEARASGRGGQVTLLLPPGLVESLEALSRSRSATLFTVLMAAFQGLLWRWSGQDDLVVGTVSAGRDRRELEPLIGPMVDFLPLRVRVPVDGTFEGLLAEVRDRMMAAHHHRHCPFEEIVRATGAAGERGSNPLYNVALLLQNLPPVPAFSDGLGTEPVPVSTGASLLDLRLVAEEVEIGLRLRCEYSADRFREGTVQAFCAAYRDLLGAVASDPGIELARLPRPRAPETRASREPEAAITVALAATFTVDPVERSLRFWLDEIGLPARVEIAPYGQVFQELLDPEGLLGRNRHGVNAVLVRLEDWAGPRDARGGARWAGLERDALELARAVRSFAGRSSTPLVVLVCPSSPSLLENRAAAEALRRAERSLMGELEDVPGVHGVTPAELAELYPVGRGFDPRADELGHLPYTQAMFAALGTMVARRVFTLVHPPYKVIVLDCDDTLWDGICGEVGAGGVVIDAPRRALQELVLAQREKGMLLALCSKNNPEDVEAVFREGPAMPLSWDDFVTRRVNWTAKSDNLRSMAAELGLGLDSFVFLDDSPMECAEVQASCPEILTLQLPDDPEEIPRFLRHVWAFDRLEVTQEDRLRAKLYRRHQERERLREEAASLDEFLEGLELEVEIAPLTRDRLPRAAQLTRRTNQFNCTTVRRTEGELWGLVQSGTLESRVIHVRDRFGDYGLVGLVLFTGRDDALDVETFLLSCRVLGRRVEHRVVEELRRLARERGFERVDLRFRATPRNRPARDFLESMGGFVAAQDGETEVFRLQAAACAAPSIAGSEAENVLAGGAADG